MKMKKHILLILVIFICGCAKPFSQHYRDLTGGKDISKSIEATTTEPQLMRGGNDVEADIIKMNEDGYGLLGVSEFFGPKIDENQAIEQAKKVKASIVLLSIKHKDTITGAQPMFVPYVGVIYTQSTTERYTQIATYWVKRKPPILGAGYKELTPELRKKTGSNKGMLIVYVAKQSPAFHAEIINGDIVRKIDNKEINTEEALVSVLDNKAGKTVNIVLIREGKEIVKEVKLNPEPE